MHAVDINMCPWRFVTGCSCCLCSRDKFSFHASCLRRAASQVLTLPPTPPRVRTVNCSGKIFVRFEPIDLIFNVPIKGYNGIHNLLLVVSVLWCTYPLSFSSWPLLLTCGSVCFSDMAILKGLTSKFVFDVCICIFCFLCRNWFHGFELRKAEKSFEECICVWEFDCPDVEIQLLTCVWVPHVRLDLHPINSDIIWSSINEPSGALHEIGCTSKHACMLSTCTCILEDTVTGSSCCLCSRDKFSSHASLFTTCCLLSSRCFHQHSQSPCLLFRYYTCKVWTDWFELYFRQNLWWDPQFTTCRVSFMMYWSSVSFFCWPLVFTPVALNVLLTRATLKGLALANFMFVYLSFVLCLGMGFVNLTWVRMKKVHLCVMELVVLIWLVDRAVKSSF